MKNVVTFSAIPELASLLLVISPTGSRSTLASFSEINSCRPDPETSTWGVALYPNTTNYVVKLWLQECHAIKYQLASLKSMPQGCLLHLDPGHLQSRNYAFSLTLTNQQRKEQGMRK